MLQPGAEPTLSSFANTYYLQPGSLSTEGRFETIAALGGFVPNLAAVSIDADTTTSSEVLFTPDADGTTYLGYVPNYTNQNTFLMTRTFPCEGGTCRDVSVLRLLPGGEFERRVAISESIRSQMAVATCGDTSTVWNGDAFGSRFYTVTATGVVSKTLDTSGNRPFDLTLDPSFFIDCGTQTMRAIYALRGRLVIRRGHTSELIPE